MQRPKTSVVNSPSRQRTPIKRHVQKTLANRSKSVVGGSQRIGNFFAGSREVHNLSSSSEADSLDNDDVDWQQPGGGSDDQNHSESEGCRVMGKMMKSRWRSEWWMTSTLRATLFQVLQAVPPIPGTDGKPLTIAQAKRYNLQAG
ncbi:hypothetical protein NE237_031362 [Protea cynaroides]|uniref:Uncharacterized protein n=1 Tax=Protea cynaroides TaxID=273540 RepID=A0A9Q0L1G2_9MAGN|nr:hypothetical protein NE237_031362 [Protea cynaroides]